MTMSDFSSLWGRIKKFRNKSVTLEDLDSNFFEYDLGLSQIHEEMFLKNILF